MVKEINMNCKDLNMKICNGCSGGWCCYIEWYAKRIGESSAVNTYIKDCIRMKRGNVLKYNIIYFKAAIENYYPEHIETYNKLMILL